MRPAGPQTPLIHPYVMQADQTDLAFLLARARPLGYIVRVDDTELVFAPRLLGEEPLRHRDPRRQPARVLRQRPPCSASTGGVEARGWDPADPEAAGRPRQQVCPARWAAALGLALADANFGAADHQRPGRPDRRRRTRPTAAAAAELEAMALDHVTCEGKMLGDASLRPGHPRASPASASASPATTG
jgi:phage protein D